MIITLVGDVSCLVEFFWAYLKKQGKKYEKKETICNTVTFNMADENIQKKSRKWPLFLKQEELLVKEVRKHPWLYNKADNSYKAHDVLRNTWESVSFAL